MSLANPACSMAEHADSAKTNAVTSAAHALDRVLLKGHYVIPHWHLAFWRILYWDKFGQPEVRPSYGLPIYSWWSREHES